MLLASLLLTAHLLLVPTPPDLRTPFERDPLHNTTATYAECVGFYKKLAAAYPAQARLRAAGLTDCGEPLRELTLSADGRAFTPERARALGRPVVFIQNGIHPGEPEGIDASMLLARDLLQNPRLRPLLRQLTVVIVPVYNIDGMLNRNATTRANQHGPTEYGFRGNARNLDLNRDFMKQDSRNARAWAAVFQRWRPEIFVDTHTSNGADYPYTMTLIASQPDKLAPALGTYARQTLLPALYAGMVKQGWPMTPYVDFSGETPASGLRGFLDGPRYSTGYAALFNSIGFMPEAHMLKPFGARVAAMRALLTTFLATAAAQAPALRAARAAADAALARQTSFALGWALAEKTTDSLLFRGFEAGHRASAVSGLPRLYYDRARPYQRRVAYFNTAHALDSVVAPVGYLIPAAWTEVLATLRRNGVRLRPLPAGSAPPGPLETYVIEDFKTVAQPYEGHYLHSQVKLTTSNEQPKTSNFYLAVLAEQGPARRYLVEALEPGSPDSFFAWGFFDSILQRKEYFSDYVFEDLAADFLTQNPAVRQQLDQAKAADPALAASGAAQLDWVYRHSPWAEPDYRYYPVRRWREK